MKTMIKNMLRRPIHTVLCAVCLSATGIAFTSCDDFFEQESTHVIFEGDNPLNSTADTLYSVIGIINKMQAIADRTILLGEVRGDLVDINDYTSADLRDLALFNVDEENIYNQPRDYYAIINNCNYFIANADTTLYDNRNNQVFIREYAAVKAFRAWTYLQLALNYGEVPFVTDPILTKEEGDREYPRKGIQEICNWLIQDIQPLAEIERPSYGKIRSCDSRLFYFPIHLLLGELNLWAGHYKEAAVSYYNFLSKYRGVNSSYPIGTNKCYWDNENSKWSQASTSIYEFYEESYGNQLITMLPGDSIPSEGYYSQLRNIFNSSNENEYRVSLEPSQSLIDLSAAQRYCDITTDLDTIYAPENMESLHKYASGDLRLVTHVSSIGNVIYNNERIEMQNINKYQSRNIHIYRNAMVYLHMAEALNAAGYPRFAYHILAGGVNNNVIEQNIIPYYRNDSTFLRQFDFPATRYVLDTPEAGIGTNPNTIGIHDRGSGWSLANEYYQLPDNPELDSIARIAYQQEAVERMIVDEGALEFAFEGLRYYDLMRVALRRNDPAFLADRIYARQGEANSASMKSEIKANLYNPQEWYLDWNGEIGMTITSGDTETETEE